MTFFMVAAMELYNTGLRMHGLTNAGILYTFHEMIINFPMAFFWQIFFCGPLVRRIFHILFKNTF